jgi:uncharacterized membrane protein YhaH (DUF805 family)
MKTPVTLRGELILGALTGVFVGVSLWYAGRYYDFADLRAIGFRIPYYVFAGLVAVAVVTLRLGVKRLRAGGHTEALRLIQVVTLIVWAFMFFGLVKGPAATSLMWAAIAIALSALPLSIWLGARPANKGKT